MVESERRLGTPLAWAVEHNEKASLVDRRTGEVWQFDHVVGPQTSTNSLFKCTAREVVSSFCEGINGTICAYGQTASGKTFTMQGDGQSDGVIQLAVDEIFMHIQDRPETVYIMTVSYLEIYNELVFDLLSDEPVEVRVLDDQGSLELRNLTRHRVSSPDDILTCLENGDLRRHKGETKINEHSSRSHAVMMIELESRSSEVRRSTLSLVDLAGSEGLRHTDATGDRRREGKNINRSLFALSQVISSLSDQSRNARSSHVGFRDSKLTRILQKSIGGNAQTVIICAISPAACNYIDTKSTLEFASRAKCVKNKVSVNVYSEESQICQLELEIAALQAQLHSEDSLQHRHVSVAKGRDSEDLAALRLQAREDDLRWEVERLEEEYKTAMSQAVSYDGRLHDRRRRRPRSDFSPGATVSGIAGTPPKRARADAGLRTDDAHDATPQRGPTAAQRRMAAVSSRSPRRPSGTNKCDAEVLALASELVRRLSGRKSSAEQTADIVKLLAKAQALISGTSSASGLPTGHLGSHPSAGAIVLAAPVGTATALRPSSDNACAKKASSSVTHQPLLALKAPPTPTPEPPSPPARRLRRQQEVDAVKAKAESEAALEAELHTKQKELARVRAAAAPACSSATGSLRGLNAQGRSEVDGLSKAKRPADSLRAHLQDLQQGVGSARSSIDADQMVTRHCCTSELDRVRGHEARQQTPRHQQMEEEVQALKAQIHALQCRPQRRKDAEQDEDSCSSEQSSEEDLPAFEKPFATKAPHRASEAEAALAELRSQVRRQHEEGTRIQDLDQERSRLLASTRHWKELDKDWGGDEPHDDDGQADTEELWLRAAEREVGEVLSQVPLSRRFAAPIVADEAPRRNGATSHPSSARACERRVESEFCAAEREVLAALVRQREERIQDLRARRRVTESRSATLQVTAENERVTKTAAVAADRRAPAEIAEPTIAAETAEAKARRIRTQLAETEQALAKERGALQAEAEADRKYREEQAAASASASGAEAQHYRARVEELERDLAETKRRSLTTGGAAFSGFRSSIAVAKRPSNLIGAARVPRASGVGLGLRGLGLRGAERSGEGCAQQ